MKHEGMALGIEIVAPELPTPLELEDDKVRDECGVGLVDAESSIASRLAWLILKRLTHRGHSAAGIAGRNRHTGEESIAKGGGRPEEALAEFISEDGSKLTTFDEHEQIITHTRYSTEPGDSAVGAHPFECRTTGLKLALNGELRGQSLAILAKKNDLDPRNFGNKTELLTNIIGSTLARREEKKALTVEETGKTLRRLFAQLEGAFCLSIIFRDMSILVRDPWGRHPLSVGFLPDGKIVGASESMAFDDIGDQDDPHLPFLEVR